MNVFQGDLWGCVGPGPGPGREGQRGVCSPTGPTGPASSMPRRRSRGGWGGTEPPRHVSGRPRGRSSRSREDARGEPPVTGRRGGRVPSALSFLCDRSSAGSPCWRTDLRAAVPTRGTILGRQCPRRAWEGGRTAPWQGFVWPKREQGNQTETFEGS